MFPSMPGRAWVFALLAGSLLSCTPRSPGTVPLDPGEFSLSDVAPLDSLTYVVVFDTKGFEDIPRVGLMTLEGRPGRVFHMEIGKAEARVLGAFDLPTLVPNAPGQTGDQYEALACVAQGGEEVLLILGERGGSDPFPLGILRWGTVELGTHEFQWSPGGSVGKEVKAPGHWPEQGNLRDVTAFYLDEANALWASAVVDGGDAGPFKSVVFVVADIDPSAPDAVAVIPAPQVAWEVPDHKIEGLTVPPSTGPVGGALLATFDDEVFGGGIRVLGSGGTE